MTLRFHPTPFRMAKIKNSNNSTCWRGCQERGTLLHCWWDAPGTTILEINLVISQKLEVDLPEDPAIPLLGIYPKMLHHCHKDTCSAMFIAALFVIART
jgi:hypothetical protein